MEPSLCFRSIGLWDPRDVRRAAGRAAHGSGREQRASFNDDNAGSARGAVDRWDAPAVCDEARAWRK